MTACGFGGSERREDVARHFWVSIPLKESVGNGDPTGVVGSPAPDIADADNVTELDDASGQGHLSESERLPGRSDPAGNECEANFCTTQRAGVVGMRCDNRIEHRSQLIRFRTGKKTKPLLSPFCIGGVCGHIQNVSTDGKAFATKIGDS